MGRDAAERIRRFIHEISGIFVDPSKEYLLHTRLTNLLRDSNCSGFDELVHIARGDARLASKIIDAMTTNETLWFRDASFWEYVRQTIVPRWQRELREGTRRGVRIWSAGCSTGQEPYSLAMLITQATGGYAERRHYEIVASDISEEILAMARTGIYDDAAVSRGLSASHKDTYFHKKGAQWEVASEIRRMVRFVRGNLTRGERPAGAFDLILCRNVLIYFTPETRATVVETLHRSLALGGHLAVGASESLQTNSALHRCEETTSSVYKCPNGAKKAHRASGAAR